jgi:hypothetical protein
MTYQEEQACFNVIHGKVKKHHHAFLVLLHLDSMTRSLLTLMTGWARKGEVMFSSSLQEAAATAARVQQFACPSPSPAWQHLFLLHSSPMNIL